MRSLPTGVVTLLFTDIEGSTTLLERAPVAYRGALKKHHRLLNLAIEGHDGVVFERLGDGIYAAFQRTTDAVAAAVQAQLSLHKHNWGELGEVRVRMAVHPGELDRWDDRYFGPALYRCARLLAVGHGGQTLLSGVAAEIVGGTLPSDCELRDLGNHRLKDLRSPEHIFQIVHPRLRADFPALRSLEARPNNIPVQLTSFVGRERELNDVRKLHADGRLITLTGPGGSGKTRFALQFAAEVIDRFPDGVFLVELAPLADPLLVLPTIAKTLGISERRGTALVDDLKSYLREKALLLVVDNFEHVLPAAELIQDLLRAAPKLKVLVTSREALRLSGERDFAMPPLDVPIAASSSLADYAAIRLFVDRAQAARPGFVLNGHAEAVVELCRRLDGLPLAIELAAARASVLSPQQLLARLDDRLALLDRGPRDLPARQRTLRAAIEWSYELLAPDERRVFARLAVFAGDFAVDGAEEVCASGDMSSPPLDVLSSLVDKSLLERMPEAAHEPRFRMLETIRAYALGCLKASGEVELVRQRHAAHYAKLAEAAEPRLRCPEQIQWLDRLDRELDNIRAAIGASTVTSDVRLRLGSALVRFCFYRGHLREVRIWLRIALEKADDISKGVRAKALNAAASVANEVGEPEPALARESLQLHESLGDREGMAWSTLTLCNSYDQQRDRDRKRDCYREAADLFAEVRERWGYARSLGNLGGALQEQGEFEQAITHHEEALAVFRELGDGRQVAGELAGLASVFLWQLGDHARARTPLREAVAMLSRVGDARSLCDPLLDLAYIEMREGEYADAERLVERALLISREFGDRRLTARSLLRLGTVRSTDGNYVDAESPFREALQLAEGAGVAHQRQLNLVAAALTGLGINALRAGNTGQALLLHERVLAAARETGVDEHLWAPLANLGLTYLARGEHAASAAYFKENLLITTKLRLRRDIHEPFEGLAVISQAAGDASTAALLAGAADALRRASGEGMLPDERAHYLPILDRVREKLGPEEFAKHWDRGRALSADDALEQALKVADGYATTLDSSADRV